MLALWGGQSNFAHPACRSLRTGSIPIFVIAAKQLKDESMGVFLRLIEKLVHNLLFEAYLLLLRPVAILLPTTCTIFIRDRKGADGQKFT